MTRGPRIINRFSRFNPRDAPSPRAHSSAVSLDALIEADKRFVESMGDPVQRKLAEDIAADVAKRHVKAEKARLNSLFGGTVTSTTISNADVPKSAESLLANIKRAIDSLPVVPKLTLCQWSEWPCDRFGKVVHEGETILIAHPDTWSAPEVRARLLPTGFFPGIPIIDFDEDYEERARVSGIITDKFKAVVGL
ncbi:hypothetical protein AEAC466_04410 [Asticcacaulis sp. AC466]|uniref:hypothetical protein n=1 Tax=Asticcacaulis sp. AC466 TaxID=1282362 RepID=UPI0003C3CAE6|nr:hypothetical protein [Asticcacaulis sp. AC466]ESQ85413.1 hypothetical protein AEAC466_04410 [Asticcacaulis sp. AC466]